MNRRVILLLYVTTFGGLRISYKGQKTHILPGRNTKMWKLLKYLLACYPTPVTIDRIIEAVWTDEEFASDPGKNVRDAIYRLRRTFLSIGSDQEYILFTNGCYLWNPDAACVLDFVEFIRLLREGDDKGRSDDERASSYEAAVLLYNGEFMGEKWSFLETWSSNFVTFYKRLFLQAIESLSELYERRLDYEKIIQLHNKTLLIEPYEESLYARLIQVLIKNGEYVLAGRQYRQMEKFFAREFEAPPPLTLQNLYEEAIKAGIRQPTALSRIKELFDEKAENNGPIFCAPDTFTQIYNYGKRIDERIMLPVFLCKITLLSDGVTELTKTELEHIIKTLLLILISNLRKGDIICRYSPSQFLLMLTTTDSSNLNQSLERINVFFRKESNLSQVRLETEVVPIKDGIQF